MIAGGPGIPPRYTVADDAGALLVRSGLVSAGALDEARSRAGDDGGTIGEQLVASGQLADDALTDFYKSRLLVPQVNPNTLARLPAKVVAVIPREMAIELRAIPVSLDKENNLTVAMSDPSDRRAVDEIAVYTGSYVVRAVATQMQIAWCLAHYYGHVTSLGQRLLQPNAGTASSVAAALSAVPGRRPAPERPERPAKSDGVPEAKPERARSVSGEIRVPGRRAPSIKPPLPDFEDEGSPIRPAEPSGPVISIEAGEPSGPAVVADGNEATQVSGPIISIEASEPTNDEPTQRTLPAPRRRAKPAEPDPPELAARAGEVHLKTGPIRKLDLDEPRVVIADELDHATSVDAALRAQTAKLENFVAPDLPDVSGEVEAPEHAHRETAPQITVEVIDRPSGPVVIHSPIPEKSEPVLLERRRTLEDQPTSVVVQPALIVAEEEAEAEAEPESAAPTPVEDEVLELPVKRGIPRKDRRTQLGVGVIAAVTKPPVDEDPTRIDAHAAPPGELTISDEVAAPPEPVKDDDTSPVAIPPYHRHGDTPVPPPSGKVKLDNVRARSSSGDEDDYDSMAGPATAVMSAVDLDEAMPERKQEPRVDVDEVDDGWGPPGTTIPPPLLGAIPGAVDAPSGIIPMPNIDSAPLMVAPPAAPEVSRADLSPQTLARTLEDATAGMLELIRTLEHARDRDEVVALMIKHLGLTHRRAGFFAVRAGELALFAMQPRPGSMPAATLRLDRPSTLQDVVGTRLPYRGPMHDDASRTFLASVLGASPTEILLVPVSLRERVVGVLFGEQRLRHTFDDQLALAARAAGQALERILKARRG
jgi:hypothetical protein